MLYSWPTRKQNALQVRVLKLLIIASILCCLSPGTHSCQKHIIADIDIARRRNRDETIVANSDASCNWKLTCCGLTNAPVRLVLQGKPSGGHESLAAAGSNNSMQYQLQQKVYNVSAGLMHGVTLYDDSCKIPVSYNGSSQQPAGFIPASLRAVLLDPKHCARDFLNYRNSCYSVSSATENFVAAAHSIRGTAQLASFSRDSEISELIASNNFFLYSDAARAKSYPFRPPLDLSSPVRFGLFYSTQDNTVLSLAWNQTTGCWLQPAPHLTNFRRIGVTSGVTGGVLCASLKLPATASITTNLEIDFVDCATPMPSLVKFPDVRFVDRAALSCNLSELLREAAVRGQHREQPAQKQPLEHASASGSKSFEWIPILAIILLVVAAGLGICFVLKWRARCRKQQMPQLETGTPESQQLQTPDSLSDSLGSNV